MDNPIRNIDPDGMADVHINGDEADRATQKLQESTSLTLSRDNATGKISATGEARTDADRKLQAAITDNTVDVRLNATSSNEAIVNGEAGNLIIGAYQGSHAGTDGKPTGDQSINMDQAQKVEDNGGNKASQSVKHEVLESYIALKTGNGIHTVGTADGNATYTAAHQGAMSLDPSYSDRNIHKDIGHSVPGFTIYFHRNPETHRDAELFRIRSDE